MGGASELTGPDLEVGVAIDKVTEGRPLLGHAAGEAVMLVRAEGKVFATGASCTHYGGPLAEGLVVGKTVRCPWHHACFDLETGLAAGPALTPIACFDVIEEKSLLRVAKKRAAAVPAPPPASPSRVVIVGGGAAGASCAENLRRFGYGGPIALVADEPPGPVDRPNLSKDYLAGNAPEEWIPLRDEAFYREMRIDFMLGDPAARFDVKARTVTLASGAELAYGALVLATGAAPRTLSISGADGDDVYRLRTLADSRAIIARAKAGARAVIVGSSFIGLEVAASLRGRNVEVDVVSTDAVPLGRVVGETLGTFVRSLHEEHGVRFHLGRSPKAITNGNVELDDGASLPCDFVVLGVGVTPRTGLAESAGLKVERGIVVDDRFRTSAEAVYAAGDVASFPDSKAGGHVRIEHWAVAVRQGRAVARSILGLSPPRDVPFFWSAHYDVTLNYVGHAGAWDRIVERGSLADRKYVAAFEERATITAAITLGEDHLALELEAAMEAGDDAKVRSLLARP